MSLIEIRCELTGLGNEVPGRVIVLCALCRRAGRLLVFLVAQPLLASPASALSGRLLVIVIVHAHAVMCA